MKNILLLMILILIAGTIVFWPKDDPVNNDLTQLMQSNNYIFFKLPLDNKYDGEKENTGQKTDKNKEIEVANLTQNGSKNEGNQEQKQEIKKYIGKEGYAQSETWLPSKTSNKISADDSFFSTLLNNSFFAPIGSSIEGHAPSYKTLPPRGIDCGGGTLASSYPPGSSFPISYCDTCPICIPLSCRCACNACPPSQTGYLWDSVTEICGCGE